MEGKEITNYELQAKRSRLLTKISEDIDSRFDDWGIDPEVVTTSSGAIEFTWQSKVLIHPQGEIERDVVSRNLDNKALTEIYDLVREKLVKVSELDKEITYRWRRENEQVSK